MEQLVVAICVLAVLTGFGFIAVWQKLDKKADDDKVLHKGGSVVSELERTVKQKADLMAVPYLPESEVARKWDVISLAKAIGYEFHEEPASSGWRKSKKVKP